MQISYFPFLSVFLWIMRTIFGWESFCFLTEAHEENMQTNMKKHFFSSFALISVSD